MSDLADQVVELFQRRQGASPIEVEELPKATQSAVDRLKSRFGKPVRAWDGIHGYIVEFEPKGVQVQRLGKDDLQMLMGLPGFRWIQAEKGDISVGLEGS